MSLLTSNFKPYTLPIILSGLAHFFLGTSALYWRELSEIPPTTLVAYRIILSTIMISVFILISRHFIHETIFKPRTLILHCTASVFIAINWGVFIWSSINGAILESGLGYLLAPFISIALGVIIYHEKIRTRALLSTGIALSSITLLITLTEKLNHWVYLLIASTWGIYTYIKKASTLDAISGLLIETLFLTACLALAIWLCGFTITPPQRTNVTTGSLNMASRRGIHDPFNTILLRHRKSTAIPDRLLTVHTATYAYSRFTHHL